MSKGKGKYEQLQKAKNARMNIVCTTMYLLLLSSTFPAAIKLNKKAKYSARMRYLATLRKPRKRRKWNEEEKRFSERLFFRIFRMQRKCFDILATKIENVVGTDTFKPETYLQQLHDEGTTTSRGKMLHAAKSTTGTYISGEWKIALTLRYLAGASYLDLFLWSNVNPNYCRAIVKNVIEHWICNNNVIKIDFYTQVLNNDARMEQIGREFGEKTEGVFTGCFGALDGWIVKIYCPSNSEVDNPGKYFSRKGVYAINVQVIVDKKKRVLWRYIGSMGSNHDSPTFHESKLGKYLEEHAVELKQQGRYLVGDSAYSLRNYLLVPYDNATSKSKEDSFNFFLSSCRIHVECCFGEVDRRWGVLWKPLVGKLKSHKHTIDACLRLHNFIVDYREENKASKDSHPRNIGGSLHAHFYDNYDEEEELNRASERFLLEHPFHSFGGRSGDENAQREGQRGRRSNILNELRDEGVMFRDKISYELHRRGMVRPAKSQTGRRDQFYRPVMD